MRDSLSNTLENILIFLNVMEVANTLYFQSAIFMKWHIWHRHIDIIQIKNILICEF